LASGVVAWRKEVLEAQQVAPIFWYPVRVQNERFSSDGTKESTSISDMDVKVLSDLEDSVFAPMFPSGAIVTDHITGQVLRVAGPDGDVEAHLAHQVKSMKELADYGATAISFWLWWMVLIIVMSTGALMMWRRRAGQARRQSHSSRRVAPFVLPFMLGANVIAAVPAQEPWVMSVLPDTKVDNSAIGVLVMVNGYFDQSVKVRDAAALLDSGNATRLSSSGAVQSVDLVLGCGIDKMVRRLFVAAGTRAEVPLAQASVVPSLAIAEVVTSGQCEALVSVIVPNGGLVAAVRGDPGVVAESSSLVAIEGGIAVRYRIRWSGCGAVAQFVVRSHDGRDTALHCDLRAPGVSRR
jgi:hypothetical protein